MDCVVDHDCGGVVRVGIVDEEPRGGFEGVAKVLEESDLDLIGADFFIEALLGGVVEVVRICFDGGSGVILKDPCCCRWGFHGGGGGGGVGADNVGEERDSVGAGDGFNDRGLSRHAAREDLLHLPRRPLVAHC